MGTPDTCVGVSSVRNLELDRLYPNGWSLAYTRADADKLYAGGLTAVNPAGEVWEDDMDSPNIGRAEIERDTLPELITEAMTNAGRG